MGISKEDSKSGDKLKTLSSLQVGEKGIVKELLGGHLEIKRLMVIGFLQGTVVENLYRSPFGNPTAYSVRGVVLALRQEDSDQIYIEKL